MYKIILNEPNFQFYGGEQKSCNSTEAQDFFYLNNFINLTDILFSYII